MKGLAISLMLAILAAAPALAAESDGNGAPATGETSAPAPTQRCVEVEIGGEKASRLDCLNQELRRTVEQNKPAANLAPIEAGSPSVQVGGFNQAATAQQLGKNFGKSVVPDRPASPTH